MIFSPDDRHLLSYSPTANYSMTSAVQILSVFPDEYVSEGSGTIIGANDVLTAAHVVYSQEHGGEAISFLITPYRFNDLKPFGSVTATTADIPSGWSVSENYAFDYALITLPRPIGYYTGWIDLGVVTAASASQLTQSYGYPGDLNSGNTLTYTPGSGGELNGNLLRYYGTMDAAGGQSGSGVLSQGESPSLIGLISHENVTYRYNGILAMTSSVRSEVMGWTENNDTDLSAPINSDLSKSTVETLSLFYYAFLNRDPDTDGLNFWAQSVDSGAAMETVAQAFFDSTEFSSTTTASLSTTEFVDYLYTHILGRNADQSGHAFWVQTLQQGYERSVLATAFSQSEEFHALHRLDVYEIWHRHYNDFAVEAYGTVEDETLIAAEGDSMLFGDEGSDTLLGGAFEDYLWGGLGNDTLTGGEEDDFFAWDSGEGIDTITDFNPTEDALRLRSDFEWSWGVSSQGWLTLHTTNGEGVVLTGIVMGQSSQIALIQG